ncbi:hypothetical protein ACOMHN_063465 [Nucella lapillus]
MLVRRGDTSLAKVFSTRGEMLSGPAAFAGFMFASNFSTPGGVILKTGMVGKSSRLPGMLHFSRTSVDLYCLPSLNAVKNWLFKASAFAFESVTRRPWTLTQSNSFLRASTSPRAIIQNGFWGTVYQTRPNATDHETSPGGSQTSARGRTLSLRVGGSQHGDSGKCCSQRGSNAHSPEGGGGGGQMNEAQAKTVLKEAVDAVVNSFAKRTHGHWRSKVASGRDVD